VVVDRETETWVVVVAVVVVETVAVVVAVAVTVTTDVKVLGSKLSARILLVWVFMKPVATM